MTANKDDLELWERELRDAGCDPLTIPAPAVGVYDYGGGITAVFVESAVGFRDTSITLDVNFGACYGGVCRLTFTRSALGGPVVMVWHGQDRVAFIDRPEEYGDFAADKQGWVARYYGPVDSDDDYDGYHDGCGCSQDSYYDD